MYSGEWSHSRDIGAVPHVLVVDDDPVNVELILAYLERERYRVTTARSGNAALETVAADPPDLILLDAMMPGLDGFTVCARLKDAPETRLIPVVIVTALTATEDWVRGMEAGADDFLHKPVSRLEIITRVRSLLRVKRYLDDLENVEHVIMSLAKAIEQRDGYTEQHTERVSARAVALGESIGLPESALNVLYYGGMLHDVGKIGIPEAVLGKPTMLNAEEHAVIQQHPLKGVTICEPLRSRLIDQALPIIRHHHERFDGRGYPDGLSDSEIPLLARIVAIADAYDAMTSSRPYRRGMPSSRALDVLREGAGSQWDPGLVEEFIALENTQLRHSQGKAG